MGEDIIRVHADFSKTLDLRDKQKAIRSVLKSARKDILKILRESSNRDHTLAR